MDPEQRKCRLIEAAREAQLTERVWGLIPMQRIMYGWNRLELDDVHEPISFPVQFLVQACVTAYLAGTAYYIATFAAACRAGVGMAWFVEVAVALAIEMGVLHPLKVFVFHVRASRLLIPVLKEIDESEQCVHFKNMLAAGSMTLLRSAKMAVRGGGETNAMLLGNLRCAPQYVTHESASESPHQLNYVASAITVFLSLQVATMHEWIGVCACGRAGGRVDVGVGVGMCLRGCARVCS
jgi:hypothetical protein